MPSGRTTKSREGRLTIRALEPADAEACAAMFRKSSVYRGTLRTPYESIDVTKRMMLESNPLKRHLVAELDGRVVGEATICLRSRERIRHVADIGMMVDEEFQGRGIGGALLDAAIDYAERWSNVLRLELEVFVDNAPAIALYRKRGFVIEGIARAFALRDGEYVDAFRMARVSEALPHPRLTAEDVANRKPPQLGKGRSEKPAPPKKRGSGWGPGQGSA